MNAVRVLAYDCVRGDDRVTDRPQGYAVDRRRAVARIGLGLGWKELLGGVHRVLSDRVFDFRKAPSNALAQATMRRAGALHRSRGVEYVRGTSQDAQTAVADAPVQFD